MTPSDSQPRTPPGDSAPGGAASGTGTYLYCLVRARRAPSLQEAPPGVPGADAPRLLEVEPGLWLVAADVPLEQYGSDSVEAHLDDLEWVADRAMPHERLVEHFADQGTVLPMKMFTIFTGDERAREHIRDRRQHLDRILARVEGHREWGVRIRLDPDRVPEQEGGAESADEDSPGTAFLLRKKRRRDAARDLATRARKTAEETYERLAETASEAHRVPSPAAAAGSRLLLEANFLVPEEADDDFEGLVQECAEAAADAGCELTLTGPWPPYNFLEERR